MSTIRKTLTVVVVLAASLMLSGCRTAAPAEVARCGTAAPVWCPPPHPGSEASAGPQASVEERQLRLAADREGLLDALDGGDGGLPPLLQRIAESASGAGVRLVSLEPWPEVTRDGYIAMPLAVRMDGTFREVVSFLRVMSESGRLLEVGGLSLGRGALAVDDVLARYAGQRSEVAAQDGEPSELGRHMDRLRAHEELRQGGTPLEAAFVLTAFRYTGELAAPAPPPSPPALAPALPVDDPRSAAWATIQPFFLGAPGDPESGYVRKPIGNLRDPFEPQLDRFVPRIEAEPDSIFPPGPPSALLPPGGAGDPYERAHTEVVRIAPHHVVHRQRAGAELSLRRTAAVRLLLLLAYVLQPLDAVPDDEFRALLDAWHPNSPPSRGHWSPERVWLTSLSICRGTLTLRGEAKDHEDVAVLLERLGTSPDLRDLQLVRQTAIDDSKLGVSYVEFELRGAVD